jgi:putative tricarboxylic transport membrane protein
MGGLIKSNILEGKGGDMMRTPRVFTQIFVVTLALMVCGFSPFARADEWPARPINFIVATAPGGSVDTMARGLASFLGGELDTAIKVVNRPGAATMVGATYFLGCKDDGYNIIVSTQPYLSNSIILQGAKYKLDDFDFINVEQIDPVTISVHADSPYKTLSDLIEAIRANPGKLSIGTGALGSNHLAFVFLADRLNLDFRVVFYTSGGPYRTALLGKHVDFISGTAAGDVSMKPNARVLAVFDDRPFKAWPDAELINEALKPYGVKVPMLASVRYVAVHSAFKAKYPERYKKLVEAYEKVFNSKGYTGFRKKIRTNDVSRWMGPEKSNAYMKELHALTIQYKDKLRPPKKK